MYVDQGINPCLCVNWNNRSASPYHGFTIVNRLNMHNLVEPVNKDLEFQLHEPFLLYRNASCEYNFL